tara:strand:+ start:3120 stop:3452 length:333 start_codon:yes stop_codon:yes gene_type:complete
MIWSDGIAWAQTAAGSSQGGPGLLVSLIPFVLIFLIFYFLLIRPQQQRSAQHKAMLDALTKGAKVITSGGLWGTITNLGKETVTLQIADSVKVKIERSHVTQLQPTDDSE